MKTYRRTVTALFVTLIACIGLCTGCAALSSAPPSKAETYAYDITTNLVTKTNFVTQTNLVSQIVPINTTNVTGQTVLFYQTNYVPQLVTETNRVVETNYVFAENAHAKATTAVIGTVANIAMPGSGTLITAVIGGILGIWGSFRSKAANKATAIANNSNQIIETARNIITALPNGGSIAKDFDSWMVQHQQDAGIAQEVAALVGKFVNPDQASGTASKLLATALAPLTPLVPATSAPKG